MALQNLLRPSQHGQFSFPLLNEPIEDSQDIAIEIYWARGPAAECLRMHD